MTGPVAPRDPEKARAYFYIMRGKEICGLKQGECTDCRKYHG